MKHSPANTSMQPLGVLMRLWNAQYPEVHLFGCRKKLKGKRVWYFEMYGKRPGGILLYRSARGSAVSAFIEDVELKELSWQEIEGVLWKTFDAMLPQIEKGGREKMQLHSQV